MLLIGEKKLPNIFVYTWPRNRTRHLARRHGHRHHVSHNGLWEEVRPCGTNSHAALGRKQPRARSRGTGPCLRMPSHKSKDACDARTHKSKIIHPAATVTVLNSPNTPPLPRCGGDSRETLRPLAVNSLPCGQLSFDCHPTLLEVCRFTLC